MRAFFAVAIYFVLGSCILIGGSKGEHENDRGMKNRQSKEGATVAAEPTNGAGSGVDHNQLDADHEVSQGHPPKAPQSESNRAEFEKPNHSHSDHTQSEDKIVGDEKPPHRAGWPLVEKESRLPKTEVPPHLVHLEVGPTESDKDFPEIVKSASSGLKPTGSSGPMDQLDEIKRLKADAFENKLSKFPSEFNRNLTEAEKQYIFAGIADLNTNSSSDEEDHINNTSSSQESRPSGDDNADRSSSNMTGRTTEDSRHMVTGSSVAPTAKSSGPAVTAAVNKNSSKTPIMATRTGPVVTRTEPTPAENSASFFGKIWNSITSIFG